jgi:uncharacterized BrkB/YihY/UPF0761 family membrane protein
MNIKAIWLTPKLATLNVPNDDASTLAAALAFYAILSMIGNQIRASKTV